MTITYSAIGRRFGCASALRRVNNSKDYGLITDVKMTRVGWITWCLEFKADYKGAIK